MMEVAQPQNLPRPLPKHWRAPQLPQSSHMPRLLGMCHTAHPLPWPASMPPPMWNAHSLTNWSHPMCSSRPS